ncbi:MAG TPA: hypothetical protein VHN77_11705 [Phycisphaerales bacterium]|nr:hypothetical protein [Phycisphaerales bacterium]
MKPAAVLLVLALLALLSPSQREGAGGGLSSRTTHEAADTSRPVDGQAPRIHPVHPIHLITRFTAIDIFIDSGTTPLAAYQLDFTAAAPGHDEQSSASVKIVGIEGGEPGPYNAAPYYDEHAIQTERVIIGALSTLPADQLPRGKVRVARIHLMATGAPHTTTPTCALTLTTAAGADAQRIDAAASWQATPNGATDQDQVEDQTERK